MAGDRRFMYPNAVFMFHTVSSIAEGKAFEIKTESDECERIFDQLCQIYADSSTKTKRQWKQILKHMDRYYRKDVALELKIVEKVVELYYTNNIPE